jgi:hypothetical protein
MKMIIAKKKRTINKKFLESIKNHPCILCKKWPTDPCHIKTVKTGGCDSYRNVLPMCREHHTMQHSKGWVYMTNKFPTLLPILNERGWEFVDVGYGKKLVNYEIEEKIASETEIELKINFTN